MAEGWFVTGTDTGVGKTVVACALARLLVRMDYDTGVMKPVSAGGREDAEDLIRSAGIDDGLDIVNPVALTEPLSPNLAAERAGTPVDTEKILDSYRALAQNHKRMIVEGAGGLLVPLKDDYSTADLAREIGLPLIIVARAALGTINHTLLTIEAARSRKLAIAGVIYNHVTPATGSPAESCSSGIISRISGVPCLGTIPHITNKSALCEIAEEHLELSSIMGDA
jgi:dethiobiotin synthetase